MLWLRLYWRAIVHPFFYAAVGLSFLYLKGRAEENENNTYVPLPVPKKKHLWVILKHVFLFYSKKVMYIPTHGAKSVYNGVIGNGELAKGDLVLLWS